MNNRVLTIIPSLYDGGAEKFTADLSFEISKEYQNTTLIYNATDITYPVAGGVKTLEVPEKRGILRRLLRQIRIKNEIKGYKTQWRPEVSISHMLMANMLNIITKKEEKVICVLHGEWSIRTGKSKVLDFIVKHYYRKADVIISVSEFIKNSFDQYYQLAVPHKVIHVGIDIAEIERKAQEHLALALPKNYLVYVAGFRPVKNHIALLNHLEAYLKKKDISLVLLGDGTLRNAIENEISKLGLEGKVLILGNLSNPYPVIKNAKVSVLYSSSESFSLAVVESMALGVPVVATDCGGPREILLGEVIHEVELPFRSDYGVLIEKPGVKDKGYLSAEIDYLLDNKQAWSALSENGKKRSRNFSIQKAAAAYKELISTLISS